MSVKQRSALMAASLSALLFVGFACPSSGVSYQPTQTPHSELTAEQRAAIRNIMAPFKGDAPPAATAQTHADLALKTSDEIRAIRPLVIPILTLGTDQFPFPNVQFRVTEPDKCAVRHYHGSTGLTLNLTSVREPSDPCGFGSDVADREVDAEALIKWFDASRDDDGTDGAKPQGGTIQLRGGIFDQK